MGINAAAFLAVLLLGKGDTLLYGVLVTVSALGLGGVLALPASMQADVIDYEEWRTGERREGQVVGVWSIAKKLAAALGAGIAFPLLGLAGYVPNAEQPDSARIALRLLYAGVPSLCNLVAIGVACRYPISRRAHRALREQIDAGETSAAAGEQIDPLA